MGQKIGYKQRMSGCISPDRQEEELNDYGVDVIHETLEGITRDGEFHEKDDVLVVYDLGVIGRKNYDDVALNIARGGAKGIYSIKDKRIFRSALPYAQDRVDAMAAINGAEYKGRVYAAKGKAGATPKLTPSKRDKAKSLAADGMHLDDIAHKFGVSTSTIRRAIK